MIYATLEECYEINPPLCIKMLETYAGYLDCTAANVLGFVNKVKKSHKLRVKKVASSLLQDTLSENRSFWDRDIRLFDEYFNELSYDQQVLFSQRLVKEYNDRAKVAGWYKTAWSSSKNAEYSVNKQDHTDLIMECIDIGVLDPEYAILTLTPNMPYKDLRKIFAHIDGPASLLSKLKKKGYVGGYSDSDLQNTQVRFRVLKKIIADPNLSDHTFYTFTFKIDDLYALEPEQRWAFFKTYYKLSLYNLKHYKISAGGFGPRIRLERKPTHEEIQKMMFPLLLGEFSEKRDLFVKRYKEYEDNKKMRP